MADTDVKPWEQFKDVKPWELEWESPETNQPNPPVNPAGGYSMSATVPPIAPTTASRVGNLDIVGGANAPLTKPAFDLIQKPERADVEKFLKGASPKFVDVSTGLAEVGADTVNFFTSPLGIATLGLGALPKAAQRAAALTFAYTMGKDVPELATQLGDELGKPEDKRDYQKIAKLAGQAAANTAFAAGGVKHGAATPIAERLGASPTLERPPLPATTIPTEQSAAEAAQPKLGAQVGASDVSLGERVSDSPSSNAESLRSIFKTQPFQDKGLGGFDIPRQRAVMQSVASALQDPEIFNSVIKSIPVDVVNVFVRSKGSPEALLHDPTVLTNLPSVYSNNPVSGMMNVADSIIRLIAATPAKESFSSSGINLIRQPENRSAALEAKSLNHPESVQQTSQPVNQRTLDATQTRQVEAGGQPEYPQAGEGGIPTETGGGNIPEQPAEGQAVREVSLTPSVDSIVSMSGQDFTKFSAREGNRGLTEKAYEIADSVRNPEVFDKAKEQATEQAQAAKSKIASAAPDEKMKFMEDALALSMKRQYFDEAAKMSRALKQVEEGKGVAEVAKDIGVSEKSLQGLQKEKPAPPARPAGRGLQLKQPVSAGEAGFINIQPVKDFLDKASKGVRSAFDFTKDVAKEVGSLPATSDYRRSVLNWSAKLQRSFGEAARIQKDIETKVKDPLRRDAITNWIQAAGDPIKLRQEASGSKNARLRAGYEAALNLTPDELNVANEASRRYAALEARANRYDILKSHLDNYVNQIWNTKQGPSGGASNRTLKEKFRFAKARTFDNFFVGEQAGYTPKTKDISKLQPIYMHEMENVIAAKELVEEMSKGFASDGRPLTAPIGAGMPVEKPSGDKATLVFPKVTKETTKDYKVLPNQPALQDWKWAAKDDAGNNIFLKADLALHPEAYNRLKNVLGKSAIKEWYQTKTTPVMEIPKKIVHGLDIANSEAKKTMLGLLAPFHQVQEATHAAGHRVNPTFNIPEIDLVRNRDQMDAARHGLMLQPDRVSENQFMEGFKQSKIISKIPALGPASDWYSNYLFHQYIPGLKFKTYQSILERNNKVYAKDLAAGKVKPEDVKILSAEQANAAFGHLNYADLGRNPTIQHIAQLGILAPDFFESRIRFAGQAAKGLTGLKVGREQILALATLALGQAALAYTSAKLTGGEWDAKHPFEMTKNGKRYTLRSVPEDIEKFMQDPRQFLHNRLSILGKGALQYSTGVDYRGRKVTAGETTKELAQQPIPLSVRGFMGIGQLSGWDQLLGAVGLKVSNASPQSNVLDRARDWGLNNSNPKIKAHYEALSKATFPESPYKPIHDSLRSNDKAAIAKSVKDILSKEPNKEAVNKKAAAILKQFEPFSMSTGQPKHFATDSLAHEKLFLKSQDEAGKKAWRDALHQRVEDYRKLSEAIYGKPQEPPIPESYQQGYGK